MSDAGDLADLRVQLHEERTDHNHLALHERMAACEAELAALRALHEAHLAEHTAAETAEPEPEIELVDEAGEDVEEPIEHVVEEPTAEPEPAPEPDRGPETSHPYFRRVIGRRD